MKYKIFILLIGLILLTSCNKVNQKEEVAMDLNVNITIDNNQYEIKLLDNETSREFIKLLPLELNMQDLNNNEKYYYLENNLPINSYVPEIINKGDIMLYGDNCLVLFYKTFKTTYSYTKIGHIDNLKDLNNNDIKVKFETMLR